MTTRRRHIAHLHAAAIALGLLAASWGSVPAHAQTPAPAWTLAQERRDEACGHAIQLEILRHERVRAACLRPIFLRYLAQVRFYYGRCLAVHATLSDLADAYSHHGAAAGTMAPQHARLERACFKVSYRPAPLTDLRVLSDWDEPWLRGPYLLPSAAVNGLGALGNSFYGDGYAYRGTYFYGPGYIYGAGQCSYPGVPTAQPLLDCVRGAAAYPRYMQALRRVAAHFHVRLLPW